MPVETAQSILQVVYKTCSWKSKSSNHCVQYIKHSSGTFSSESSASHECGRWHCLYRNNRKTGVTRSTKNGRSPKGPQLIGNMS